MKRRTLALMSLAILLAAIPPAASAQSTETQGQAGGITTAQGAVDQKSPAEQASAEADAKAKAEARAQLDAILQRGAQASAKSRAEAEGKLQESANQVNENAVHEGDTKLAGRLAGEFGTTADALLAEKQALGASWGELMIAHLLQANGGGTLTVEQIYQMKKEGGGWGQIAAGMGLQLGEVVSAARAEGRVAVGLAKGDGRVQPIKGAGANVRGAGGVGVKAGGVGAGVKAGAGVDVKVKPGKP